MTRLTQRQTDVLDAIRESIAARGFPPTLRELMRRFGIRSTNGVNDHLRALERKGFIVRVGSISRGIRISDPGQFQDPPPTVATPSPEERTALLRERVDALRERTARIEQSVANHIAAWLEAGSDYDRALAADIRAGSWRKAADS